MCRGRERKEDKFWGRAKRRGRELDIMREGGYFSRRDMQGRKKEVEEMVINDRKEIM